MEPLAKLRELLQIREFTGVIVPITNAFQGEYIPDADKRLQWLTGFRGSNGMAIVLAQQAAFFTDGRYTIQAAQEVDASHFALLNINETKPQDWLKQHTPKGAKIAYDPWLHTQKQRQLFQDVAKEGDFSLVATENLIDLIWLDQPAAPTAKVRIHDLPYAGLSSAEKRTTIATKIREKGADLAVLSAGDSICWLLNIRGGDIPFTPFVLAFATIDTEGKVALYADPQKFDDAVLAHLGADVQVKPIDALASDIATWEGKRVSLDPNRVGAWFFDQCAQANAHTVESEDPCQQPKACKNATELEGARQAHLRDGIAMVNFLYWYDQNVLNGTLNELEVTHKLEAFRREQPLFQEPSFETIAGFGPNGAIIHYRVTPQSSLTLTPNSLFLLDSGGQYLDGTTDITRTLPVGTPTEAQKRHCTLVLKGMIAVTLAQFPDGTTGGQLDILARHALWQERLNYDHGTGHGIGSYLSVHEGPQGISHRGLGAKLEAGMLLSNEPGYYKTNDYGIRIENVIAVVPTFTPPPEDKENKAFFGFETLTLAPIDLRLVDATLLTPTEREWLNAYHQRVYDALSPHLEEETRRWLQQATRNL